MGNTAYENYCLIRDRLGYTDYKVAKETGIGTATMSNWKNGKYVPKTDKLQKIANLLGTTEYFILNGEEKDAEPTLTKRDTKEITEMMNGIEELLKQDGLMFDGNPASQEAIDSILSAMKIGMEMAKQRNKEKYTPKKYKKD